MVPRYQLVPFGAGFLCETMSHARTGYVLALQGCLTWGKLACPNGSSLVEMKTETFSFGECRITEQWNCEVGCERMRIVRKRKWQPSSRAQAPESVITDSNITMSHARTKNVFIWRMSHHRAMELRGGMREDAHCDTHSN